MTATTHQFAKYLIVGLASNLLGYILYLTLTQVGLTPKLAMSVAYCIGVSQTFLFNKKWTFKSKASNTSTLLRYCISYGLGYIVNFFALSLFVDYLGWPHQWVQGVIILFLAAMLFLLQKLWVFRNRP